MISTAQIPDTMLKYLKKNKKRHVCWGAKAKEGFFGGCPNYLNATIRRVARFQHLAPIALCPRPNVGIFRTTRNDKFLVAFLNVTFVRRDCSIGDTNVTFTPLAATLVALQTELPPHIVQNINIHTLASHDRVLLNNSKDVVCTPINN